MGIVQGAGQGVGAEEAGEAGAVVAGEGVIEAGLRVALVAGELVVLRAGVDFLHLLAVGSELGVVADVAVRVGDRARGAKWSAK